MLGFTVDGSCTRCGLCVLDCPARIISIGEGGPPSIAPEREHACYRCQHCLAVCPTGAVSILGRRPGDSFPLAGNLPSPVQMEVLVKGRRSVRRYRDENLDPGLVGRLLDAAWHAPTGVNSRQVLFTVVDDRERMAELRRSTLERIGRLAREGALPEGMGFFADFARLWEERGEDVIFRGAPHLLLASAPGEVASPLQDCVIALSYFELLARANGVGTVWCGLAKMALTDLVPEARERLAVPADHLVGYAMLFGPPAVTYPRTVQHGPARIHRYA